MSNTSFRRADHWQPASKAVPVLMVYGLIALLSVLTAHSVDRSFDADATNTTAPASGVSILVYHRIGPVASNEMTIRASTFQSQLQYLKAHHYNVIPLRTVVAYLLGKAAPPPPSSVVITIDDGHRSVCTEMLPVLRQFGAPVTLFIYPSAISNASYAMTWAQLATLRDTKLFDVQSHTYWHPNFNIEKRRLAPAAYREFATKQLCRARSVLAERTGTAPDLLAWPFGIHNDEVAAIARECGYVAAFTLGRRPVVAGADMMTLPRFLVTDDAVGKAFAAMLPPEPR
jgi:peptidoglycan/xylan/chitin deacetylase (PgdA/CDA1 family)